MNRALLRYADGQIVCICEGAAAFFVRQGLVKADQLGVFNTAPGITHDDLINEIIAHMRQQGRAMQTPDRIKAVVEHIDEIIAPPMTALEGIEALEAIRDAIEARLGCLTVLYEQQQKQRGKHS